MIRTQISLDEKEYALLKKQARSMGVSIAELVRRGIRQILPADESKPWMQYCGFVASGDPRSSESIDEIVYGAKD